MDRTEVLIEPQAQSAKRGRPHQKQNTKENISKVRSGAHKYMKSYLKKKTFLSPHPMGQVIRKFHV